jgi:integrase/recombinase XerD
MRLELTGVERVLRAVLYYSGLRVTPICNLKVGDLDFSPVRLPSGLVVPGSIYTEGKGGRKQAIPMHPYLKDVLMDWVLGRMETARPQHWVFSHPRTGRPFRRRLVEKIVRGWGERAGVLSCTPHRFRHTLATDLFDEGVDSRLVQAILGHRDPKSTQVYMKVRDARLSEAVSRLPVWDPSWQGRPGL